MSRLYAYRLEKVLSFMLCTIYISSDTPRNSPSHSHVQFLPGNSSPAFRMAKIFLVSFLQQKQWRKGHVLSSFSFLTLKTATHELKYWQENWKFMTQTANVPHCEIDSILDNLVPRFQDG